MSFTATVCTDIINGYIVEVIFNGNITMVYIYGLQNVPPFLSQVSKPLVIFFKCMFVVWDLKPSFIC